MLQRIRDGLQGQKWLAWLVLGAIGLTFVFWGGSGALDFSGMSNTDRRRSRRRSRFPPSEATQAWSDTQARWSRQFGTEIPDEQRVAIQKNILDDLVLRKLVEKRLDDAALPRERCHACSREFQKIPQFQGPDGKFDADHRAVGARADQQVRRGVLRRNALASCWSTSCSRASAARTS